MNKFFLIACCLVSLTSCVGYYSHSNRFNSDESAGYNIEGGESFELRATALDDVDVGEEELVSFE
jgi:hypothetical protein